MLVETPAIKMSVDIRSIGTKDGSMQLCGMADTMPCQVTVTRREVKKLLPLVMNWRVIVFALGSVFSKSNTN
jgi:hypothetical protein